MKKPACLLLCLCLAATTLAQKKETKEEKERRKQHNQEMLEQAKRADAAYRQRIATPPRLEWSVSADIAGQYVARAAAFAGFTFKGYQPAANVFGADTPQMALFTAPFNGNEFNLLGTPRDAYNTIVYLALAVADQEKDRCVVAARIGLYTVSRFSSSFEDRTIDPAYRPTLDGILENAQRAALANHEQGASELAKVADAYTSLKIGATKDAAFAVLGKGKLLGETETAQGRTAEYEWRIGDARITLVFENDKLSKKSQTGLR